MDFILGWWDFYHNFILGWWDFSITLFYDGGILAYELYSRIAGFCQLYFRNGRILPYKLYFRRARFYHMDFIL